MSLSGLRATKQPKPASDRRESQSELRREATRPSRRPDLICLALLVAAFVGQGLLFACLTPPWQAPDEPSNLAAIARDAGLKSLGPTHYGVPDAITYSEIHYHMTGLIALPGNPPPTAPFESIPTMTSSDPAGVHFGGYSHAVSLYSLVAIPVFDLGATHGVVGSMYAVRVLGVAFGALAVVFTFLLARELGIGGRLVPILAAAVVAFVPQFGFITASVNKDSLASAVGCAALWVVARMARRGVSTARLTVAAAIVVVGGLVKVTLLALGLPLAVTAGVCIVTSAKRSRQALPAVAWVAVSVVAAVIVAALVPGTTLDYGRRFLHSDPAAVARVISHRDVLIYMATTSWGDFSWLSAPLSSLAYAALFIVMAAGAAGFTRFLVRHCRSLLARDPAGVAILAGLASAIIVFALVMLVGQANGFGSQGRFWFPAIGAFATLLVLGLNELFPILTRRFGVLAAIVAGAGFNMLILLRTFPDRFGIL